MPGTAATLPAGLLDAPSLNLQARGTFPAYGETRRGWDRTRVSDEACGRIQRPIDTGGAQSISKNGRRPRGAITKASVAKGSKG
jgi:hypothetical protein